MVRWDVVAGEFPKAHGPTGLLNTAASNKETHVKQGGGQGLRPEVLSLTPTFFCGAKN